MRYQTRVACKTVTVEVLYTEVVIEQVERTKRESGVKTRADLSRAARRRGRLDAGHAQHISELRVPSACAPGTR